MLSREEQNNDNAPCTSVLISAVTFDWAWLECSVVCWVNPACLPVTSFNTLHKGYLGDLYRWPWQLWKMKITLKKLSKIKEKLRNCANKHWAMNKPDFRSAWETLSILSTLMNVIIGSKVKLMTNIHICWGGQVVLAEVYLKQPEEGDNTLLWTFINADYNDITFVTCSTVVF